MQRLPSVYSINPKQLDRFRDRHSVSGAKDDDLDAYVLHYSERLYGGGMAFEPPGCAVSEIGKDGKFKELLAAEADTPPYPESGSIWWSFDAAELFSNKNFTEFGFRGTARENAGEQPAEKKWRWDKKKKAYVALDWKMGAHKAK